MWGETRRKKNEIKNSDDADLNKNDEDETKKKRKRKEQEETENETVKKKRQPTKRELTGSNGKENKVVALKIF